MLDSDGFAQSDETRTVRDSILNFISKQTRRLKPVEIADGAKLNKNSVRRELQMMLNGGLIARDENHAYGLPNESMDATASITSAPTEDAATSCLSQVEGDSVQEGETTWEQTEQKTAVCQPASEQTRNQPANEVECSSIVLWQPSLPLIVDRALPALSQNTTSPRVEAAVDPPDDGTPSIAQKTKSPSASLLFCPRCAGKRIAGDVVQGKRYTCRRCGESFNESLQPPPCPRCHLTDMVRRKKLHRKSGQVLLRCMRKGCKGVTFPLYPELKYEQHSAKAKAYAIYHALKGLSYRDICGGLPQFCDDHAGESTVRNWIKDWIVILAPLLLSLKLDSSGTIYLDEMWHKVEHVLNGQTWWEELWQWNTYDLGKKTRLAVKLARSRETDVACEVIMTTLNRIRMPEHGIQFWCDQNSAYAAAYRRLVREGKIDETKVKMNSVPKTEIYSAINEIEGVNNRWRKLVEGKLKIMASENPTKNCSLENAEVRLLGEIIMMDFIEPRKEFKDRKTAAQNANANISFGPNQTEALVNLAHILKQEMYKRYAVSAKSYRKKGEPDTQIEQACRKAVGEEHKGQAPSSFNAWARESHVSPETDKLSGESVGATEHTTTMCAHRQR